MMGYADRTWCTYVTCPNESYCYRKFSAAEQRKAEEWWGGKDFPLAVADFPECEYWNQGERNES